MYPFYKDIGFVFFIPVFGSPGRHVKLKPKKYISLAIRYDKQTKKSRKNVCIISFWLLKEGTKFYLYQQSVCTSINRPLSYPFRSLVFVVIQTP